MGQIDLSGDHILRAFIDGSPDSVCIRDREYRLVLWNDAFAKGLKLNCGIDVCEGMRVGDFITPGNLAGFEQQHATLVKAFDGEPQRAEFAYPCPDGVIRHFDVRWSPIVEKGEVIAVAEVARDITEEEAGRAKLKEAEGKYRSVVENANEAIIVSQDGQAKFWNPQALALTGYTDDEIGTVVFTDFIHPDDVEKVKEHYRRRLSGEAPSARYSTRLLPKSGETLWVIVNSATIDWGGHPASLVMLTDITERVIAQEESRRQQEALARMDRTAGLDQLAGSIAHELNQPLTGILSNAQAGELLVQRGACCCEEMSEIVRDVISDAKRAGDVIRNLRDLYRRQDNGFEPVNINDVVGKTVRIMRSEFVVQHAMLTQDLAECVPDVQGNVVQLQQVMINLITNAHEAMDGEGFDDRSIRLVTEAREGEVLFSVTDSGSGIQSKNIDRIFEPLATWKSGGTGMGLAISNSIVQAHGGRMWAENRPEGGAQIGFVIPVKKEASV
jgi:PAS domain S-box-containing protein